MNKLEKTTMEALTKSERCDIRSLKEADKPRHDREPQNLRMGKQKMIKNAPAGNWGRASSIPEWSIITTRPHGHLIPEKKEKDNMKPTRPEHKKKN